MVSFRFHIVSIVAVFLALALGIAMGVTVIDKATVDLLQRRLDSVHSEVDSANERSDQLQENLSRAGDYEEQAEAWLIDKKLTGVAVTIVAVRGANQDVINELRNSVVASGANLQGTLWFEKKTALDDSGDLQALASGLDSVASNDANVLRQALLVRVNAVLAGATDSSSLTQLVKDGFLEWEGAEKSSNQLNQANLAGSRLIFISGANPEVSNDLIALPMVRLIAAQPVHRLVVVEPGRNADSNGPAQRGVFLGPVRSDGSLDKQLSSVDHVESSAGRVATVLALAQLPSAQFGDYGYGPSTDGPIPKKAS